MIDLAEADLFVRQLHARYVDAVWRKDVEEFGACFASDAQWRLSGMIVQGRPAIMDFMAAGFTKYRRILLTFRTPQVAVANGELTARTYVSEQSVLATGQPYAPIGTYYERFKFEDGAWRFGWRLFLTEYIGPPDLTGTFFENPDFGPAPAMPPLDEPSYNRSGILAPSVGE
jgi:uncharacterized protein (TIGR02246 family)